MNEKDKKAFDKWFNSDLQDLPKIHDAYERHIWQSACENKQKEIDIIKAQLQELFESREKLWEENIRLIAMLDIY